VVKVGWCGSSGWGLRGVLFSSGPVFSGCGGPSFLWWVGAVGGVGVGVAPWCGVGGGGRALWVVGGGGGGEGGWVGGAFFGVFGLCFFVLSWLFCLCFFFVFCFWCSFFCFFFLFFVSFVPTSSFFLFLLCSFAVDHIFIAERTERMAMFLASGRCIVCAVRANAERISPPQQRLEATSVLFRRIERSSTSMLPVSGAAQFTPLVSEAMRSCPARPRDRRNRIGQTFTSLEFGRKKIHGIQPWPCPSLSLLFFVSRDSS